VITARAVAVVVLMSTAVMVQASATFDEPRAHEHGADGALPWSVSKSDSNAQSADSRPVDMDRTCETGDVVACVNLAVACERGSGMKVDKVRAASLYARACELGEPFSCTRAASMYEDNRGRPDPERARDLRKLSVPLYQKACSLQNAPACANLADMYAGGRGVERDVARALELRTLACSVDPQSCFDLGNAYYRGEGVAQDLSKAVKFFGKACDHGDQAACFGLAGLTERNVVGEGGAVAALPLYKRACDLGFKPACREVRRVESGARERPDGADTQCDRESFERSSLA
jgi:TPR repeat protein